MRQVRAVLLLFCCCSSSAEARERSPVRSVSCPPGTRSAGQSPPAELLERTAENKDGRQRPHSDFEWCTRHASARQQVLSCTIEVVEKGYRKYCEKQNGTKHGPALAWSKYGERILALSYRNGREHGERTTWYSGGQKRNETLYHDGRRHGPSKSWHTDGKLRAEEHYDHGAASGLWKQYYDSGRLQELAFYHQGKAEGLKTHWSRDGKHATFTHWHTGRPLLALMDTPPNPEDTTGSGQLDREAIQKVVQGSMSQIQACYERALPEDSTLAGTIVVQWTIMPSGKVTDSQLKSTDNDALRTSGVTACALDIVGTLRFSKSGGAVSIHYPFVFRVQGF